MWHVLSLVLPFGNGVYYAPLHSDQTEELAL